MAFGRKNQTRIMNHITAREEFQIESMSGKWITHSLSNVGQLNYHPETLATINTLLKDRDLYVVYSYATPIAYAYDRTLTIPAHKYSATTNHHQALAKAARDA